MALLRGLDKRQKIRYLMILLGIFLFITPFGLLPQLIGESGFCGTYCPRMFWTVRSDTTISSFIAGIVRSYGGVILVAGIVITSFLFGRYWCSHVCPIGGTTEIGSKVIPEGIKLNYSTVPASAVRYGYLGVYLLAPLFAIGSLCCNYCNFAVVPRLLGAPFNSADMPYFFRTAGIINLVLIAILGFFAKGGRAYCNMLCPIGALDAISNKIGSKLSFTKRIEIVTNKCDGCGSCVKSCPVWAVTVKDNHAKIDQFSCIPCKECEIVCPNNAICYGRGGR